MSVPDCFNKYSISDLFDEIRHELQRFLFIKLHDTHDAEDVLQDLYLKLSNLDFESIKEIQKPREYLFTAANHLAIDHLRTRQRQQQVFVNDASDLSELESSVQQPERILEAQQQKRLLLQALELMPAKRRQAFLLYRYKNFSRAEIGQQLGLSEETVKKHIVRALQDCRDHMNKVNHHGN